MHGFFLKTRPYLPRVLRVGRVDVNAVGRLEESLVVLVREDRGEARQRGRRRRLRRRLGRLGGRRRLRLLGRGREGGQDEEGFRRRPSRPRRRSAGK